ncbi:DUF4249 domain-containing protein [Jejuia spongiicola]|uniref:DUF4249 domain-containing protein n=1 Tax=Jejuia spongiicola TaxID=2942207 RepID=A0ABT0QDY5_9FLAO|nr:DUF4249 domain-containing protein [Jejuia spongiicola]MCL6295200.1 DUF4249 domain-containing protein [Jejuia spongiicola]
MKYIKQIAIIACLILASCEDVIDVTVPTAAPRLVVEASIDWEKGTVGNNQTIKLHTSTPYFDTTTNNIVTGATVKVTNTNSGAEFTFADQNNGTYTTSSFIPVVNDTYTLEIVYNGENYQASETLKSVSDINRITQSLEGGFDDEVLDVTIFWDDPADEENYYLVRVLEVGDMFPFLEEISDEFINGNEIDDFFEKDDDADDPTEEFNPGDTVDISLFGISERYHNYMQLLIEQYDSGGDPFSSVAAEIRGNCINTTTPDNYAFGYFRLTQVVKESYTFQ